MNGMTGKLLFARQLVRMQGARMPMKLDDALKELRSRIHASPLAARFVRGAIWSVLGAAISRGLALIASVVTARILGQTVFGQLGMIQSTVGTFGAFAGLGLGMTATKYLASLRVTDPEKAGRILALLSLVSYITATAVSLGLILYAPVLARETLKEQQLTVPLQIGAILMLFGVVNGVQTGALAGFEVFRAIARVNLVAGISSFPLVIAGGYLYGLNGTLCGLVGSIMINCWLNNRVLRRVSREQKVFYRFRDSLQEKRVLITFTLPSAISSIIVGPVMWYSNLLLVNRPNGYAEMAIFSAAQQWQNTILFLPTALAPMMLSVMSNTHESCSKSYLTSIKLNLTVNFILAGTGALLVSLFSPLIMASYGASFQKGWVSLVLLAITALLMAILSVPGNIFASSNTMWFGFCINLSWAVFFIAVSRYLVIHYSGIGLATTYVISYAFMLVTTTILMFILYKKRSRLDTPT